MNVEAVARGIPPEPVAEHKPVPAARGTNRRAQETAETENASRPSLGRPEPEAPESVPDAAEAETLAELSDEKLLQNLFRSSRLKLDFRLDERTQKIVISVIDSDTEEVIRQVPPEEILRLAEQLESVRGSFFSSKV